MAEEREVGVRLTGDASGYINEVEKAAQQTEQKLSDSAEKVKVNYTYLLTSIGMTLAKVGQVINENLNFYLQQGLNELKQIEKYSATFEKLGIKVDTKEIEEYITKLQKLTGISDVELRPALLKATVVTKDFQKSLEILKLASDMASTGIVDVYTAASSLALVSQGADYGLRMLVRQFGLAVPEGAKTEEIFRILHNTFDGLAETIHSKTSGTFVDLQNKTIDLRETIGKLVAVSEANFIPSITKMTEKVESFVNKIIESNDPLANLIKNLLGVVGVSSEMAKGLGATIDKFLTLIQTLALMKMAGFGATIGQLGALLGGGIGTTLAIGGLVGIGALAGYGTYRAMVKTEPIDTKTLKEVSDILTYQVGAFKEQDEAIDQVNVSIEETRGKMKEVYDIQKEINRLLKEASDDWNDVGVTVGKLNKEFDENKYKVSDSVVIASQLVGLRGEERDRMRIIASYTQQIRQAEREGRLEEARQLKRIMEDELALYNEQVAERKRREEEILNKRVSTIRDEIAMSKMSEQEKINFKIQKEIEANMDLVRLGKLTYDEVVEYAKAKFQSLKETASWAKAELLGPLSPFTKELTGLSFTQKKVFEFDITLRGVSASGTIGRQDAINIATAIMSKIRATGGIA